MSSIHRDYPEGNPQTLALAASLGLGPFAEERPADEPYPREGHHLHTCWHCQCEYERPDENKEKRITKWYNICNSCLAQEC